MKYRGFLVLSVLLAGVLATTQTSDGATTATPAASAPQVVAGNAATGKETFTQYCSVCHGVAAKGFIGPYIAGINWTTPGLHAIVRGGLGGYGGMPAFNADAVSDRDIANIAAYLATLPAQRSR
jgi:mono/diheme cytochrome c family protein